MTATPLTTQAIEAQMLALGRAAREAAVTIARASTATKNSALMAIADQLSASRETLIAANRQDLEDNPGLDPALSDRLELTNARIDSMIAGVRQVAELPDPIGEISDLRYRPSGIQVGRMRVPLGVVGIIYESRPNVTADAAALTLKAGNASILRGGSESLNSNRAIEACVQAGLAAAGLPGQIVQVVPTTDRAAVGVLLGMSAYVDVLVPRGGKGLIERVSAEARMPVIKHLDGVCHVYVDAAADLEMAKSIALNAKTQRYGTCNTMETLLVDACVAEAFLPMLLPPLFEAQVACRGCERTVSIASRAGHAVSPATEADWFEEYLAPILAIRVVDDFDAALAHIRTYGSAHTDAIVTNDYGRAHRFLREVDSSSVMVNASTRFADGFEYGLGAEIGISTDKFHARGPVGLEGLTSQKFVVFGQGQVRV